jgi:release factor glutamine methyltransferase
LPGRFVAGFTLGAVNSGWEHERVGDNVVETTQDTDGLGRSGAQPTLLRRRLRKIIHHPSYHFILKRERKAVAHAAGCRLTVRPTVFHPAYFLTSEFFAGFADVGTGSGILALAAARAGAANVVAIDINPNAACSVKENAGANGFDDRVTVVCSNLLAALAPRPHFDVILSSPPSFPGEPLDLADRAWHAGPNYRDIASLFGQARKRLAPGGRFYVLLSSDSDIEYFGTLVESAGFRWRILAEHSIMIESFIIYELRAQ